MDTLTEKMLNIYCADTKESPFVKKAVLGAIATALSVAAPILLGLFGEHISYGIRHGLGFDPQRWEAEHIADKLNLPPDIKNTVRSYAAAGINPFQALNAAGINPFNPELSLEQHRTALEEARANRLHNRMAAMERLLPSSNTNPLSEVMNLMKMFEV
jgi:hypothetical protein